MATDQRQPDWLSHMGATVMMLLGVGIVVGLLMPVAASNIGLLFVVLLLGIVLGVSVIFYNVNSLIKAWIAYAGGQTEDS